MPKRPDVIVMADPVETKCPCGGKVIAAMEPEPMLLHAEPRCPKFDELDPGAFLEYCRKAQAN